MYSPGGGTDVAGIARGERWHRVDTGGQLRAAIFGISDGLLSNLSLVIGVAGANPEGRFIVLTGIAGLLAGAFSMGAGEFVSVTSQRELFERQIALEKEELESNPEEERKRAGAHLPREGPARRRGRGALESASSPTAASRSRRWRARSSASTRKASARRGASRSRRSSRSPPARSSPSSRGSSAPATPFFVASVVLGALAMFAVGAGVSLFTGRNFVFAGVPPARASAWAPRP